jgi:plasmid maintenance system killer protein
VRIFVVDLNFGSLEVFFTNKHLETLYTTGKSPKYRLPTHVIDKFFATVQKIEAAESTSDLAADKGLRFKKLANADTYSMRLNDKYRLEMSLKWEDENHTVGQFLLFDITNHYGD